MDVNAYDSTQTSPSPVSLGNIAEQIWVNGFKFSEDRNIQQSVPVNAAAPSFFDRATSVENFSFAAGRSFDSATAIGDALKFLGTHPASVPRLAHIQFLAGTQAIWLRGCAIKRIELVQKSGALVVFSYTVAGGIWTLT